MYVASGQPFEAVFESGISGLVPGVEIAIIDNVGNVVVAASGVGITEQVVDGNPNSGIYAVTKTAPIDSGQYTLVWSTDGTFDTDTVTVESLVVQVVGSALPPIGVPEEGVSAGPCSMWANLDEIANCCNLPTGLDQFTLIAYLTSAMTAASELLYISSGKQYAGACQRVVRPCDPGSHCNCGYQVLSRGHLVRWNEDCWGDLSCGCTPVSKVKLAGTVRSITEVKIDGVVLDPSEYRVDEQRWLVRLNGSRWPACQSLDLADDQPGTFSVTYVYGKNPPEAGKRAALQLACEIFKSCTDQDCALPTGVTRISRQGVTFERSFLQRDAQGIWRSGLAQVDLFLNAVNAHGIARRATFWSPARRARYARGAG